MKTNINQTTAWALAVVLSMVFFGLTVAMAFQVAEKENKEKLSSLEADFVKSSRHQALSAKNHEPGGSESMNPGLEADAEEADDGEVLIRADDVSESNSAGHNAQDQDGSRHSPQKHDPTAAPKSGQLQMNSSEHSGASHSGNQKKK